MAEFGEWVGGVLYEDQAFMSMVLRIGRRSGDGIAIVTEIGGPGAVTLTTVPDGEATDAVLRIPSSLARLLHDALCAHYGGSPDLRSLRADYNHERGRVDKLIDAVIAPPTAAEVREVRRG